MQPPEAQTKTETALSAKQRSQPCLDRRDVLLDRIPEKTIVPLLEMDLTWIPLDPSQT